MIFLSQADFEGALASFHVALETGKRLGDTSELGKRLHADALVYGARTHFLHQDEHAAASATLSPAMRLSRDLPPNYWQCIQKGIALVRSLEAGAQREFAAAYLQCALIKLKENDVEAMEENTAMALEHAGGVVQFKVFVAELHRLMAQSERSAFQGDVERERALGTAERLIEEALAADPNCAQAYVQRGMCRLLRIGQQMPSVLEGLELGGRGGQGGQGGGGEQGEEGNFGAIRDRTERDVISQFEEALRRDPQNHVAHLHWAMVSMQLAIFEVSFVTSLLPCSCACSSSRSHTFTPPFSFSFQFMNDFAEEYATREKHVEQHFQLACSFAARSGFSSAKDVCAIWVNHAAQIAFIAYLMQHDLRTLYVLRDARSLARHFMRSLAHIVPLLYFFHYIV